MDEISAQGGMVRALERGCHVLGHVRRRTRQLADIGNERLRVGRQLLPNPPALRRTPLDIPVALFAVATYLSVLGFAGHLDQQLVGLLKATGGFLIFFLATQSLIDRSDLWLVLGAVIATGLVQAVSLAVAVFTGSQLISADSRASGIVIDPNLYAGYLVLIIPLVMAVGLSIRSRWALAASAVALVAFTVALIATLSRSGWIGVLVATVVLAVLLPKRRWSLAAVGAGIALALLAGGMLGPITSRLGGQTDGPIAMLISRWGVWTAAVAMAVEHPLFGVGVANFINYYPDYSGHGFGLDHAHNIFLNMLAERGLIGLGAFVLVLVVMFRSLTSALGTAVSTRERTLVAGLIALFVGYLAHSMLDVSYYDYKILLLFWVLVGAAAVVGGPVMTTAPSLQVERSARPQ